MAGVDHGVGRQLAQFVLNGPEDGSEVGERTPGGTRATREQGVTGEHRAQCRRVEAGRSGGVTRGGDGVQLDAVGFEHLTVLQGTEWLITVGRLPQHGVGGIQ